MCKLFIIFDIILVQMGKTSSASHIDNILKLNIANGSPFSILAALILKKIYRFCLHLIKNAPYFSFPVTMFEEGFELNAEKSIFAKFTSTEVVYPQVKKFEFHFGDYFELTREFLQEMDEQFPDLERLHLQLEPQDNFSSYEPTFNVPYKPLYFKKLKNLSVFAFGEDVRQLFDYMAISNAKLKELSFGGMTTPTKIIKWIESCERLGKLTLDCPYLNEDKMNDLREMKWLREVKLEGKSFLWDPMDM